MASPWYAPPAGGPRPSSGWHAVARGGAAAPVGARAGKAPPLSWDPARAGADLVERQSAANFADDTGPRSTPARRRTGQNPPGANATPGHRFPSARSDAAPLPRTGWRP